MIRTLQQFAVAAGGQLRGADAEFREVSIDSRKLERGALFAALRGEHTDGHEFVTRAAAAGAAGAVVQRYQDVTLPQVLVADVEAALRAVAVAMRAQFGGVVLAVAGSNGKTTAKEMIGAILARRGPCLTTRGNLNNHLGVPLTLLRLASTDCYAVIEMGANHAGDVQQLVAVARPSIGVITNAGAEHLEGFGSLEGAARAEGELVAGLAPGATAIINADDPFAAMWRDSTPARVVTFGLAASAQFHAQAIHLSAGAAGFSTRFRLHSPQGAVDIELALAGRHNVRNALAAAATACAAGASLEDVAAGLAAMRAVKGRLQFRQLRSGAWLIDDSYNANPSSVRAGLEVLGDMAGRRWLVLGDMAELGSFAAGSHREVGELARAMGVERLYAFGPLAALAADSFGPHAERYQDAEVLAQRLRAEMTPDVRLLVKGSRLNRLERVVEALGN